MKKVILILLLSFSFLVFDIQVANAQDPDQVLEFLALFGKSKDSLSGLEVSDPKKVGLMVSLDTKDEYIRGLTEERIRTKCELRLRQAGLEPVDAGFRNECFSVEVGILSAGGFIISSLFRRTVVFKGEGTTYRIRATTWEKVAFGTHGRNMELIMSGVDGLLDSFLNEYLKANSK